MYFSHTTMYQIKISYNHRVHSGSDNKNVTQSLAQGSSEHHERPAASQASGGTTAGIDHARAVGLCDTS